MKSHLPSGATTPYGFRLGYIERRGAVTLTWLDACYRVKGFYKGRHINRPFYRLNEARRFFRSFPCARKSSAKPSSEHLSSSPSLSFESPIPTVNRSRSRPEMTIEELTIIIHSF